MAKLQMEKVWNLSFGNAEFLLVLKSLRGVELTEDEEAQAAALSESLTKHRLQQLKQAGETAESLERGLSKEKSNG